ncbi:hypothetical protein ACHAO7_000972 [Fusarium culmorum]
MDFVKNLAGGNKDDNTSQQQSEGGSGGGFMDKASFSASSYASSLTYFTAVDYVQENFLGGGSQNNESAVEQAKDEAISDAIRDQYKGATGSEFPIADK